VEGEKKAEHQVAGHINVAATPSEPTIIKGKKRKREWVFSW